MIYGLYLSASGVLSSSYRQDVLANNLANSETVGFKRDLALFQERPTALNERHNANDWSDPTLEGIGGGMLATPTLVDTHQGDLEQTGNPLDAAITGDGYFAVANVQGQKHLTRDGRFMLNRNGDLVLGTAEGQHVLDDQGNPIHLSPTGGPITISETGTIAQGGGKVAKLGLFDIPDHSKFRKQGGDMLAYPDPSQVRPALSATVHSEFQERSNVDPTNELAQLMDAQRQLEANANMIKYQDSMLQELVSSVGKIS